MPDHVEGVVLCRVGEHRLAVRARDVASFAVPSDDDVYAGGAFGLTWPPSEPRALRGSVGTLAVDTVEVLGEPQPVLAVPPMLRSTAGGALLGFIQIAGALWPLVSLDTLLARTLEAR